MYIYNTIGKIINIHANTHYTYWEDITDTIKDTLQSPTATDTKTKPKNESDKGELVVTIDRTPVSLAEVGLSKYMQPTNQSSPAPRQTIHHWQFRQHPVATALSNN